MLGQCYYPATGLESSVPGAATRSSTDECLLPHQPEAASLEGLKWLLSSTFDKAKAVAWRLHQRPKYHRDPEDAAIDEEFFAENKEKLRRLHHQQSATLALPRLINAMERWLDVSTPLSVRL
ncbi:hypothetical protein DL766_006925 [Monosporascus sp. MC13-8B]|uniref:Uncharacterized protein n=1 Tax=Monosporascus cannonballus TaxID=155416 RepID=A0ABY0GV42_9PEZI|nr:hypothetical protein DL762_008916 [Monosporascus cannonballus]RYO89749.1 hypothetical protein DL763_005551 [Monosporascus cannonballus]RYP25791.1 hypothetical protein DL766_006925 [Monosporascus sp. MC13-8B]